MKTVKFDEIKINENNPRFIKDESFKKLVKSIKEFPEMLNLRPIVVNKEMIIIGGNMRYKACIEAGIKEIPVIVADNLTPEQEKEFLIKDNVSGGEWDWDVLLNEWQTNELSDWGLNVPEFDKDDDFFETNDNEDDTSLVYQPKSSDDDYSTFELVMLHENKIKLLETLNQIKTNFMFEKHEEALMELIRIYNNK